MNIQDYINAPDHEQPLDNIVTDGGFCGIFRTIGCIGDSLSSGEFESKNEDGKVDYHDFDAYLKSLDESEPKEGYVPASTFFAYDRERDILVGAVDIRHSLNEALLLDGGHIGDGVRPSERRKGYATEMIALALDECRKLGIEKVLMVCNKENTGSAKSIRNNGGVLENEINVEGETVQRYWIQL
mgnify:CR=1 FL=1